MNMDVHTKKQRSFNMSRIKNSHTRPEEVIANLLKDLKIPHVRHTNLIIGRPDFFIPALNLVIEIQGCFWHGHQFCKFFVLPKSNIKFWDSKISENIERDFLNRELAIFSGLRHSVIWECEIKNGSYFEKLLNLIS